MTSTTVPLGLQVPIWLERRLPWGIAERLTERNTAALRKWWDSRAVRTKPVLTGVAAPGFEVHALLGQRHIGMTLWSVKSFIHHAGQAFKVVLHDDGSLTDPDVALLESHLPGVVVVRRATADLDIAPFLEGFPNAREYRFTECRTSDHRGAGYNMFLWSLILLDFNLLTAADRIMILDVDVLFFRRPDAILDWIQDVDGAPALFSVETFTPYRDTRGRLQYRPKVAQTLNSGLLCLRKPEVFNLAEIDRWIGENRDLMFTSAVFEQLCYSFLLRRVPGSKALPGDVYSFNYTADHCVSSHFGVKRGFFDALPRVAGALVCNKGGSRVRGVRRAAFKGAR